MKIAPTIDTAPIVFWGLAAFFTGPPSVAPALVSLRNGLSRRVRIAPTPTRGNARGVVPCKRDKYRRGKQRPVTPPYPPPAPLTCPYSGFSSVAVSFTVTRPGSPPTPANTSFFGNGCLWFHSFGPGSLTLAPTSPKAWQLSLPWPIGTVVLSPGYKRWGSFVSGRYTTYFTQGGSPGEIYKISNIIVADPVPM